MKRGAVVINPSKVRDVQRVRRELTAVFKGYGWAEPLWLETTVTDSGRGQAQQAVEEGVDLICALGGDGTVRCAASAVRDTGIPLALLPAGTGNLLARNLRLSVRGRSADHLRVALSGRDRAIDVGTLRLDRDGDGSTVEEHCFLVMAGMGLDADMLDGTPDRLKARIGWIAYVAGGFKHLRARPVMMDVAVDGQPLSSLPTTTVLIGNCGQLTGGVRLMPRATIDDGLLDGVVMAAGRLTEWSRLVAQVLSARPEGKTVRHVVGRSFAVTAAEPRTVQVDGDILGPARAMTVGNDPGALLVRVP